jgi:Spy/CpxP family protein refolding chaperone
MYPGMLYWWKVRHYGGDAGVHAGRCGVEGSYARRGCETGYEASGRFGDAGLGVRRPLRFLAYKLELDEKQVGELAKILADLKTERAQAEVDGRRTLASFADALGREQFDEPSAQQAAQLRVASAERLREAVVQALKRLHAMLDPEQRERLAYLIRTGTLTL